MSTWITAHASAIGSGHVRTGTPCQDACEVRTSPDGHWFIVVVSDGAGTAPRSNEGSTLVASFFSDELLKLSSELDRRAPGHWINDFVIARILATRDTLRAAAKSDDIKDFNCTLVACMNGPSGGFSIHIGDGSIVGGQASGSQGSGEAALFLSPPENGEYANETYFITQGDWIKHVRITPMPPLDWIVCCTDGGGSLALVRDNIPKIGFLEPVFRTVFAKEHEEERNKELENFLTDPQADKVTGDDKTVVIAIRTGQASKIRWLLEPDPRNDLQDTTATPKTSSTPSPQEPHSIGNTESKLISKRLPQEQESSKRAKEIRIAFILLLSVAIAATVSAAIIFSRARPPSSIKTEPEKQGAPREIKGTGGRIKYFGRILINQEDRFRGAGSPGELSKNFAPTTSPQPVNRPEDGAKLAE